MKIMSDSEITALAREYADMLKHLFPDMPEHTYRDKMSQAKNVINIIMRRYCLVEKSKMQELEIARRVKANGYIALKRSDVGYLFPEIAKEV